MNPENYIDQGNEFDRVLASINIPDESSKEADYPSPNGFYESTYDLAHAISQNTDDSNLISPVHTNVSNPGDFLSSASSSYPSSAYVSLNAAHQNNTAPQEHSSPYSLWPDEPRSDNQSSVGGAYDANAGLSERYRTAFRNRPRSRATSEASYYSELSPMRVGGRDDNSSCAPSPYIGSNDPADSFLENLTINPNGLDSNEVPSPSIAGYELSPSAAFMPRVQQAMGRPENSFLFESEGCDDQDAPYEEAAPFINIVPSTPGSHATQHPVSQHHSGGPAAAGFPFPAVNMTRSVSGGGHRLANHGHNFSYQHPQYSASDQQCHSGYQSWNSENQSRHLDRGLGLDRLGSMHRGRSVERRHRSRDLPRTRHVSVRSRSDSVSSQSSDTRPLYLMPQKNSGSNPTSAVHKHRPRLRIPSRRRSIDTIRNHIIDLSRDSARPREMKNPATFVCPVAGCQKRFTRAYNLRSHQRTHTNEKPYLCSVCEKAFARQHDRRRHERLHSGLKDFECQGKLSDGNLWGCGKRFARMDALSRHFRSEIGKACVRPLLLEGGVVPGGEYYDMEASEPLSESENDL